jgi:hypothetical protein
MVSGTITKRENVAMQYKKPFNKIGFSFQASNIRAACHPPNLA